MDLDSIRELREVENLDEINRLLATGEWRIFDLVWYDDETHAKLVRVRE